MKVEMQGDNVEGEEEGEVTMDRGSTTRALLAQYHLKTKRNHKCSNIKAVPCRVKKKLNGISC